MKILGIESSCDETAAAVVEDGRGILSSVVHSQIDIHRVYGGVVPEIACRSHIETIHPVVEKALADAGVGIKGIDAVAVTCAPGLVGALLIGVSMAKSLALVTGKPLIGVDHIHGHIYACKLAFPDLTWPCVSMVVSGGHTSLYRSTSEIDHEALGGTTDDAAGEAFDKVAKILELGFPGGPIIDGLAKGRDPKKVAFKRTVPETLDFSFSGLKTAVLYRVRGQDAKKPLLMSADERADVAAGFQEAVVDVLIEQALKACLRTRTWRLAVGGGVACNTRLREKLGERAAKEGVQVYFPPPRFCTDNAAMIAGLGYHLHQAGRISDLSLDAVPTKSHKQ
ncbi:MAG TPA: tRNA (adenosine(37)-N6)-threonylcarbamoyltransferase complex transferase subunit TsaD [Planctomycetota bacterium]|nr:tRNA (adenosine(37)-N6)-threonylcarbamoyltransferase complex transferase subunit TsaD [Planctomycetota bacterium]